MPLTRLAIAGATFTGLALGACGTNDLLNDSKALDAKKRVARLKDAADTAYLKQREYPEKLDELVTAGYLEQHHLTDPWGRPMRYERRGSRSVTICSAGPSEDDPNDDICASTN